MDEIKPLLPLDYMKRHGVKVAEIRTRRIRAQRDARLALQAVILLAGVLLGMLLALGIATLLGL